MKTVVLISGKLRSGKNLFSSMLTELLSSKGKVVTEEMFARDLKDGAREDFGQLANVLNNIHENLSVMLDRCVDESVSDCIISDMKDEITKLAILL